MPVLPSYREQPADLHSKSIDWFLYEDNTGIERVKSWQMFINYMLFFYFFFKKCDSLHAALEGHYKAWDYKKKRNTKMKSI